jgi:hypothetical protein
LGVGLGVGDAGPKLAPTLFGGWALPEVAGEVASPPVEVDDDALEIVEL